MRTLTLLLLFIICLVPTVYAETEYTQLGGTNNDFLQGNSGFNEGQLNSSVAQSSLSDGRFAPLIDDLDGDGVSEIVVLDGGDIRIFQNTTLGIVDAVSLDAGSVNYTPPVLFDIDSDGFVEVIVAEENQGTGNISVVEYNGTSLHIQDVFDSSNNGYPASTGWGSLEGLLGCDSDEGVCLHSVFLSKAGSNVLYASAFNASGHVNSSYVTLFTSGGTYANFCLPQVPVMAVGDVDVFDGSNEFVFSGIMYQSGDESIELFYVDVLDDWRIDLDYHVSKNTGDVITSGNIFCNDGVSGRFVSSPLIDDVDGASGNGLEVVIAYNTDPDEYKMEVYSAETLIDTHPALVNADGEIMSNIMLADLYGDTPSAKEYCVVGQATARQEITILCGSYTSGRTSQLVYEYDGLFNLSSEYENLGVLSHTVNSDETTFNFDSSGNIDTSEFLTSHGVFRVDDDVYLDGVEFKYPLDRIYGLNEERSCVPLDYEGSGSADIICSNNDFVYYINDGVTNRPPSLTSYSENPCFDSVIGVNNSFGVSLVVTDENDYPLSDDPVSTNVTIYYGTANQQSKFFINKTSGSTHNYLFSYPNGGFNLTGDSVVVRYEYWDTASRDNRGVVSQTVVVGNSGVNYGDCTSGSTLSSGTNASSIGAGVPATDTNNQIVTGLNTLHSITGLGGLVWWFIIMICFSLGIWFYGLQAGVGGNALLGMTALVNVSMLIVGSLLGVIGTSLIIIITVIGGVIVALTLGKFLTGAGSGE